MSEKYEWLLGSAQFANLHHMSSFFEVALTIEALRSGTPMRRINPAGHLRTEPQEIVKELLEMGFLVGIADQKTCTMLHPEGGYVCVDMHSDDSPVEAICKEGPLSVKLYDRIAAWVEPSIYEFGGVYALSMGRGRPSFTCIGHAARQLHRQNYDPKVVEQFDHAARDLSAPEPCGRLVLLIGPAGTGKTHLVRGFLHTSERPRFVIVQAHDVTQLSQPSTLAALREFANDEAAGRPITLVLEDADHAMVPRGSDNISEISAILNLSDGLMGATFDIRIIATTNAKKVEIDPAIVRAGRLCQRIEVNLLSSLQANALLDSLLGVGRPEIGVGFNSPATLADVYARARLNGWQSAPEENRPQFRVAPYRHWYPSGNGYPGSDDGELPEKLPTE